ncbi:hypothetical protein HMPREF3200_00712 [Anaerococcus tetradius]|uniref:5-nitroimidazole antibiotic resistance protein n=2 Tax=Anaerococcus tetradius TaxID=33036 RepID=A0A133KG20_9FIRM|nr:hypothetical protein HMPREF3200_00712 [Anaerococcus tetradius]
MKFMNISWSLIMRRTDREKDSVFAKKIIDKASFGVMTIEENGYSIPLTFARDGDKLYFHGAREGVKNDLLRKNNKVRIVFVGENHLPEPISDEEIKNDPRKLAKLFTLKYESAIISGSCRLVDDNSEKNFALSLICQKFYRDLDNYIEKAIEMSSKLTACYRVDIESIEAKSNID